MAAFPKGTVPFTSINFQIIRLPKIVILPPTLPSCIPLTTINISLNKDESFSNKPPSPLPKGSLPMLNHLHFNPSLEQVSVSLCRWSFGVLWLGHPSNDVNHRPNHQDGSLQPTMWGHIGENTNGKLDKDDDLYIPNKKQQQLHEVQFALHNCSFFAILDFNLSPKKEKHGFHICCLQHHHEWAPWKPPYQRNEKRRDFTAAFHG